jgi:signal peptidase I
MKNIYKIIYWIFITAILLVACMLVISIFPITGNIKFLTVLSGSMEPAIHTGSVVVVKPMGEYAVGDVITFGPNTRTKPPTTHRVVEVKDSNGQISFVTKGDANNAPDQTAIVKNQVIGKVVFDVPYAGYAITAARKPLGFLLIIVLPALLVIIDELQNIWREIKKRRVKKKEEEKQSKGDGLEK